MEEETGGRSCAGGREDVTVCSLCSAPAAVSICTCQFPWQAYCPSCIPPHTQTPPASGRKHSIEPTVSKSFLVSPASLPEYYERQYIIQHMVQFLKENEDEITLCRDMFSQFAVDLQRKLAAWISETQARLDALMDEMRGHLDIMTGQLDMLRFQSCFRQDTQLAVMLANMKKEEVMKSKEKLRLFTYEFKPYLLTSVLTDTFSYSYSCAPLQSSLHIASFSSDQQKCTLFCLADRWKTECDISGMVMKSGAAWCILPGTNEVLYCGGQSNSLVCRETYIVDLIKKQAKAQATLARARFSHAIAYYEESVFVFGGNSGDETLKTCENFNLASSRWAPLSPLNSPRYGASASVHKSSIFIAGGMKSASCEVYDPVSDSFTTLSLVLPSIDKFGTVLALDGELLIFHDKAMYEWSLTRVNKSLGKGRDLPQTGNWYSPMQPIKHNGVCYFFRSDYELWELTSDSKELLLAFPLLSLG